MTNEPTVVLHLRKYAEDEALRESLARRCRALGQEFHEIARCEISLAENGGDFVAHGHVTGKSTDVATHASASEIEPALDQLLHKVERQLRRGHDKRIFGQRRDARRDPTKRREPAPES